MRLWEWPQPWVVFHFVVKLKRNTPRFVATATRKMNFCIFRPLVQLDENDHGLMGSPIAQLFIAGEGPFFEQGPRLSLDYHAPGAPLRRVFVDAGPPTGPSAISRRFGQGAGGERWLDGAWQSPVHWLAHRSGRR
jgi:hypothetical protein